jgi:hypothetical protein
MHRKQLQHVILEIGLRFDLKAIYIVGSAAILAAMPDPRAAAHLGLIQRRVLLDRLEQVDCSGQMRKLIADRIAGAFAA